MTRQGWRGTDSYEGWSLGEPRDEVSVLWLWGALALLVGGLISLGITALQIGNADDACKVVPVRGSHDYDGDKNLWISLEDGSVYGYSEYEDSCIVGLKGDPFQPYDG